MLQALQDIEVDIELVYRYGPWGIPRPWLDEQTDSSQSNDASAAPVETRVGQAVEVESQITEPEKMRSANELSNTSQSNDASAAPVETRVGQAVELESQLTEPEKMRGANKLSDEQEDF